MQGHTTLVVVSIFLHHKFIFITDRSLAFPSGGMLLGFVEGSGAVLLNFIPRLSVLHVIAAVLT